MARKSAIIIATIILCMALCAHAQPPVKIGATLGLTGKYTKMAQVQENGFRLWVEQINQRGGLLGRQVELVIYDDQSDKATAKKLYEKLLMDDGAETTDIQKTG